MTAEEETRYVLELSKLAKLDANAVQAVVNAQLALFLAQLATEEVADTVFGKIHFKKGLCHIENPNTQVKRLSTEFGMKEKLALEFPFYLDD